jgi:uncharacterized DUF497 family protein
MYEWDEAKRQKNVAKHGVDFPAIESFEWETALVIPDNRKNYGELRSLAYGLIGRRLYCATFTVRGTNIRIISLRKANDKEVERYG